MAKYQAYAEYKDSGVEWLGVVPSHWIITTLKRYCYVKGGFAFSSDAFIDTGYPVIRIGDIKTDGSINLENCKYIPESLAVNSRDYLVEKNQLLMAMTGATIGKAGLYTSNQPAFLNQRVGKFELLAQNMNYRYLWYILKTDGYQEYIKLTAFGGAQPNISDTAMVDYPATIPSFDEQTQIANFLDHETSKIDHLIEKQQKLIELLKEKRQAVISHAVTKGLDPNVPMKDSGVEWLGEVPEHWVIPRLKQLIKYGSSISYGIVQPGDALDEGIPFIQTTNISKGSFELQDFQKTSVAIESNYPRSRLEGGEVILGIRASIGAAFVVPMSFKGVNLSRGIARIIPNALLKSDFLVWYFKSNAVDQYWGLSKQGSTFSEVSIETVRELSVVVPPIDEQEKISEFLSFELGKLERLISSAENQKLLLLERRTALISAAVTGKIDIRNWQAPSVIEADTELSA